MKVLVNDRWITALSFVTLSNNGSAVAVVSIPTWNVTGYTNMIKDECIISISVEKEVSKIYIDLSKCDVSVSM
jgi:hypothetical protein